MRRRVYTENGEPQANCYYLFGSDSRGWRRIHRVRLDQARRQCARGVWREVFNAITCELVGFRLLSPAEMKGDEAISTMAGSTAAIKKKEIEAWVGMRGPSRTVHLCEDDRLTRKQPEDFIERWQAKVSVWPHVGAECGDILRAWAFSKRNSA